MTNQNPEVLEAKGDLPGGLLPPRRKSQRNSYLTMHSLSSGPSVVTYYLWGDVLPLAYSALLTPFSVCMAFSSSLSQGLCMPLLVPTLFSPSFRSDLCANIIPHRGAHPSQAPHLLCFSSQHSSLPDYRMSLSFIVRLGEKSLQESGGFELLTAAPQGLERWLAQGGRSIWIG